MRMITKREIRFLVFLLVLGLVLAACGGTSENVNEEAEAVSTEPVAQEEIATPEAEEGGEEAAAEEEQVVEEGELTPLVVSFGGVCICHAPIPVGIEKGIFEKHGLALEYLRVDSGFEAHAAVLTGDAQVADSVVAVAAQAAQQGVEATAVFMANGDPTGTVNTDNYFAVVARADSGIREGQLEDLAGKKVGLLRGAIGHQWLFYALTDHGLDPTADIEIVNVAPPDLPSALQSGSVDAIATWEPLALQALNVMDDAILVYRGGGHIDYLFQRWMSPEFIEENPETVKAFVEAFAESAQYVRQHPEESAEILAEAFEGLDPTVIPEPLSYLTFDMRVSQLTLENAEKGLEFARMVGALEGSEYNFADHFEPRFINEVMEEHPEYFSDLPPIPEDQQLTEGSACCGG